MTCSSSEHRLFEEAEIDRSLTLALSLIPPPDEIQFEKKRQGRNYASRQRTELVKRLAPLPDILSCPDCEEPNAICLDPRTNEFICTLCGLVLEGYGRIESAIVPTNQLYTSKGYRTIDYVRERLNQFNCGPWIWDDEFFLIEEYALNSMTQQELSVAGKLTWGRICKSLGLGYRKYGERWIQIRKRLQLRLGSDVVPLPNYSNMAPVVINTLAERTSLVSDCYKTFFKGRVIDNIAFGKNIISTSYIFIQNLRMMGCLGHWKDYIYISKSRKKLATYNRKWKRMVPVLQKNYSRYIKRTKDGDEIENRSYSWSYQPLLPKHVNSDVKFV